MSAISIIVPVYNTEEYLPKCLNSILQQTLKDIEIICVNDGSTDGSLSILEEYSKKDSRIIVINKINEGPLVARNAGLNVATGEYIGYVDSDDWIDSDMYESLYNVATKYNVDIVSSGYKLEGNYTTVHYDNVIPGYYDQNCIQLVRDNTIFNKKKKDTGLRGTIWCKLFKKDILKRVQFGIPTKIKHAEDKMIIINYILNSNSIYVMDEAFYHWRINNQSITHSKNNNFLYQIAYIYEYLDSLRTHPNFSKKMMKQSELYLVDLMTKGINSRLGLVYSNLLRIDPIWMKNIKHNSKIMLYGSEDFTRQYKKQLSNLRKDVIVVKDLGLELPTSEDISNVDLIVIAIKNEEKSLYVREELVEHGVPESKISWTPQPEFYWKYVEAEGLMD